MPRNGDLAVAVRRRYPDGVDALLDNVSYAPDAYDAALKDGARVASPNNAASEGSGRTNLMAAPTSENLERLARLLDTGIVNVPIHQAYPLEQAPAAMNALLTHHTQGKLAVQSLRVSLRSSSAAHASDRFRRDSAARTVGPADHISGVSPAPIPRRPSRACCRLPRNARISGPRRPLRPRERKPRPRSIPCALRTRTRRPRPLDPLGARSGICGTAAAPRGHRVPCNLVARAVDRSRREERREGRWRCSPPPCRRCATMSTCP
jgi:hypothetical protein